jgi:hypothetical protein
MYLNGWQRIQKIEGNQTPFCNAGNFKPSSLITLNWSTYLGMSNLLIENGAILITFMHCSMFLKSNYPVLILERNKTHIKVIK